MSDELSIPSRDRDKSYIGRFCEVISQVKMDTSDGSTVVIDMENIGQIQVKPWSSDGELVATYEDRTVFNPVNGHDVMILEFMAEHARKVYEVARAEAEQIEAKEQPTTEHKKPNGKPPQIVTGESVTEDLNRFALK